MITVHSIILRTSIIFLTSILLISCGDQSSNQTVFKYDQLCQIYKDIVSNPVDLATKEMNIMERVEVELPDFFKTNFIHIAQADADQRYSFIKKLADEEAKSNWACEVMKSYYENEFKQP